MTDATPLHMVQLHLDTRGLLRSGRRQGLRSSEDLGYLVHGHLAALFGDAAPRPFRATPQRQRVEVLGYGSHDAEALRQQAQTFAAPMDLEVLSNLASKAMPTRWTAGQRLGFEVRTCPTVRLASALGPLKARAEVDAYQAAWAHYEQERGKESAAPGSEPARAPVYREWLRQRLEPAAELTTFDLNAFHRRQLLRRTQGDQRQQRRPELPDATFRGQLEITDPQAFAALLARGVGRHRAFGFGLLLLRPPTRR